MLESLSPIFHKEAFILLFFYFFAPPLTQNPEVRVQALRWFGFKWAALKIPVAASINCSEFLVEGVGLNRRFRLSSLSSSGSLQLESASEILFPPSRLDPFFL